MSDIASRLAPDLMGVFHFMVNLLYLGAHSLQQTLFIMAALKVYSLCSKLFSISSILFYFEYVSN